MGGGRRRGRQLRVLPGGHVGDELGGLDGLLTEDRDHALGQIATDVVYHLSPAIGWRSEGGGSSVHG